METKERLQKIIILAEEVEQIENEAGKNIQLSKGLTGSTEPLRLS